MSLISQHYSKTQESKCHKSSGEEKNILRQKSHDQKESRVFCIFFTWTPETSFFLKLYGFVFALQLGQIKLSKG